MSPLLSNTDRQLILDALITPPEIKAKANYGDGQIPNYDELRKNHIRTEQILSCSSFNIALDEKNS